MNNRIHRYRLLLLCLLLQTLPLIADEMQIFELKGATPQEIIPLIKPFVGEDGTVTGMHNQLIIRTSAERMAEVHRILQEFDRAPRRLLIHVRDSAPSDGASSHIDLSLKKPRLQIGEADESRLYLKHYTTERTDSSLRTLQTIEGRPTLIAGGIIRPEVTRDGYIIGPRGGFQTSIDYRNIDSGFYATVRLVGERVRIEITTLKQAPINGSPVITHQSTDNTVSGTLGEWLLLATTQEQRRFDSSGISSRSSTDSVERSEVWVKVELLPE